MTCSGLFTHLRLFAADENGATAIEYALIASGLSIVIVGAVSTLGTTVTETLYDKIAQAMSN